MILIIDAYNILKQLYPAHYITDTQRISFLGLVRKYTKRKDHRAIVVFDGGPYDKPWIEQHNGITIAYSGIHESADDYIRDYIVKNREQDLLLVSSDNSICSWANKFKRESIDAMTFYAILQHEAQEQMYADVENESILVKTSDRKNPELDALMKQIENVPRKKEELKQERKGTAQRLSKKDRKMVKKASKL
ncbi:MAG TPA: NYN domain-containing protein [Candidatus Babeliales bacterium]|nr:NYN domain-containing protein [Candidatus Babeliales bacterium]